MKNFVVKFIYRILAGYARKLIKKHNPFVIGVTGSVGKSSTKEAIYMVMKDHFGERKVRANYGSLNAEFGIPLTILGYNRLPSKFCWFFFLISAWFRTFSKTYPDYLILEMGVDHPGDVAYFSAIVEPNIVIITSLAGAHLTNFKSIDEYQKEKLSIMDHLKDSGQAVVNWDDPVLSKQKGNNIISIAVKNQKADYSIESFKVSLKGIEYRISTTGQKISIKSSLLGKQFVYAQLFAFVIGIKFGINFLDIKRSLEKLKPLPGRMNLLPGLRQTMIIDDTYNNSGPTSAKAALDVLQEINYAKRKVLILGNMNELGENEERIHREIGSYAKGKCDFAVFAGPNAQVMAAGYDDTETSLIFKDRKEIIQSLDSFIEPGDLILVKASQNGNFFEEIVKNLLSEEIIAKDVLVRQSVFWLKKKK